MSAGCGGWLIRRNRTSGESAFFGCYAPVPVRLAQSVAVVGRSRFSLLRPSKGFTGRPLGLVKDRI